MRGLLALSYILNTLKELRPVPIADCTLFFDKIRKLTNLRVERIVDALFGKDGFNIRSEGHEDVLVLFQEDSIVISGPLGAEGFNRPLEGARLIKAADYLVNNLLA